MASGRCDLSAVALALAVCFKPIAAPLLLAVLLVVAATSGVRALRYGAVFVAGVLAFYALPFLVLGWDASPLGEANAQLALSGAMSPVTVARLWTDSAALPGHWWLLGLAWLPALGVVAVLLPRGHRDFAGLLALGVALTLVFFLVRPWLSETNVALLLAPAVVLVALGRLDRRLYAALWVLPLLMTLTYLWPVKLFWAVAPDAVAQAASWAERSSGLLLVVRVIVILAWQVAGWSTVVVCLSRVPGTAGQTTLRVPATASPPGSQLTISNDRAPS